MPKPPAGPSASLPGRRLALLVAALFLPDAALAAGLGEASGLAALGEPLSLQIPLLGSVDGPLDNECLVVDKSSEGIDPEYFPRGLTARLERQPGAQRLVLTSRSAVQQPIIEFRVTLTCGYNLSRNYLLLVSPRRDKPVSAIGAPAATKAAPAAAPSSGTSPVTPAAAPPAGSGALPDGLPGKTIVLNGALSLEALARQHYESQPIRRERFMRWVVEANPQLFPGDADPRQQRLAGGTTLVIPDGIPPRRAGDHQTAETPRLDLRGKGPAAAPAAAKAALPATPTKPRAPAKDRLVVGGGGAPIRDQKETIALIDRLTGMMEQQLSTQTENHQRMAQLESAMAELSKYVVQLETQSRQREEMLQAERRALRKIVEEQADRSWWQLVAAILAGGLLGAGFLHGLQRLQAARGRPAEPTPAPLPAEMPVPEHPAFAADHATDDFRADAPPPRPAYAAVPTPAYAPSSPQPAPAPVATSRHAPAPEPEPLEFTPPAFASAPPPPPSPPRQASSVIQLGTTPLVHPPDEALELVNIMMSMGLKEGAADTLVQHIREYPRQSLHHWLKLLELHRHSGNQAAYEQTVREMRSHFNVQAADWEPDGTHHVSQSLEDFPHIRSQLIASWGTPECIDYLQHLLTDNREGTRLGFPIGPTEDILLLLAILRFEQLAEAA